MLKPKVPRRTNHKCIQIIGYLLAACMLLASVVQAQTLDIRIVSKKEVVFDWKRDRCEELDIPDTALQAYRRVDGQIVGFDTHWKNRRFLIDRDYRFQRDCNIVFKGDENPDPAAYNDKIWITAPWTDDGRTVYALGHNEYQGQTHPGRCTFKSYQECWYNSVVLLKSSNGGDSFTRIPGSSPVANAAFRYEELQGAPRGFFGPTNAMKDGDHLYTIIFTTGGNGQKRGNCLFRASSYSNAESWEYWTGERFYPSAINPYQNSVHPMPRCEPLKGLNGRVWSIRRHRPTGLFLATVGTHPSGAKTGAIGISVSRDLYEWSRPIELFSVPLIWSDSCNDHVRYSYPSLIDLNSPSRNFSDVGNEAEIYMTELKIVRCGATLERNLVRYRIAIKALPSPN